MKKILLILILLNSDFLCAQISFDESMAIFIKGESEKINSENLNDVYSAILKMFSQYNSVNKEKYSTELLQEHIINYKSKLISSINESSITLFEQNAKLTLEKDLSQNLIVLKSKIPLNIDEKDASKSIQVTVQKSNFINNGKNNVNINEYNRSNFGTLKHYENIDGIKKENTYKTIEIKFGIDNKTEILSGSLVYNLKILTDYSTIKIGKVDYGKTFVLNNRNIKIIGSTNNIIIIEGFAFDDKFDINAINLDQNENVIKSPSTGKYPIFKDIFDIYRKNPNISITELKKELPLDKLQKMKINGCYLAIFNDFPFLNNFILFSRIYGISKNIEIKL
ncbi:hypothetical protein ACNQGB_01865 [Flavobacterium sp. XS1P32]|uniref:hypothetical protein n=1 Tax=Flavobacterium sp. XS1P32 TaxID=3401726 RepID=UPI003AAE5A72